MAGSVNRAELLGYLGQDPEVRSFPDGNKVANFSLATSESWADRQTGEKRERTEWHRVSITVSGLAGVAERFLKKGSRVYLAGQIQTRKWTDRDGNERTTTEIVVGPRQGQLVLLDGARASPAEARGGSEGRLSSQPNPADPLDDDVPF